MNNKTRILVCPLNWGLGHASRMVPIINQLLKRNHNVIIAADGVALEYLKNEFPFLKWFVLPQYRVKYSNKNTQLFTMLRLLPALIIYSIKEHFLLKRLLKREQIDCVISDNRYGLWNKSIYSVFITHQLNVLFPGVFKVFEPISRWIVKKIIRQYNECWVPDFEDDNNLSGILSHIYNYPTVFYIGPLSRFTKESSLNQNKTKYDILIILSGPEPQRTIFEQLVYRQLLIKDYKVAIVRGANSKKVLESTTNISVFEMVNSHELLSLVNESKVVVCRSGYSSVMDLVALQKTAVIVPTPGQTEQEYLATYLYNKGLFYTLFQKDFCIDKAIRNKIDFPMDFEKSRDEILMKRIDNLEKVLKNEKHNKSHN
ncbi:MAG: hypothetical protein A2W99_11545 [Bacteroidetes bacterium GWF2_33_16]|nr:MAG: hypothetical protein A2X00_04195 [Bacteroidetes bacterium GWE2_32_14]OFY04160.1 MAG: hypothetical protein A2W99_11545 [Bacteroidetes bacterium GWF2_33_16]